MASHTLNLHKNTQIRSGEPHCETNYVTPLLCCTVDLSTPSINISGGLGTPRTAVPHAICHLWFAIYRILSPHPKHLGPQWAVRHTMAPLYCLMIHRCLGGARECPSLCKRLTEPGTCEARSCPVRPDPPVSRESKHPVRSYSGVRA